MAEPQKLELSKELFIAYRQMLTFLFISNLVLLLIIALPLFMAQYKNWDIPLLPYVALSGALGAFFSALTRLYSLERLPVALLNPHLKLFDWHLLMYALIPPIVGMVGAC